MIFLICFIRGYLSIMTKVEGLTSSLELTWIFFCYLLFFFSNSTFNFGLVGDWEIRLHDFFLFTFYKLIQSYNLDCGFDNWLGLTQIFFNLFFFQIFPLTLGWGELGFKFFFNLLYIGLSYFHNYDCKFWRLFRVDLGHFFFLNRFFCPVLSFNILLI